VPRITGTRGDQVIREPDFVPEPTTNAAEVAQQKIIAELSNLATQLFDTSRPVDEYQSLAYTTSVEVLPEFELDELIETIIIVATAAATITIQLGNRNWAAVIPAQGFIEFDHMKLRLSRHDRRIFTLGSAGPLSVELMGHADTRGGW
jgi:hypothetical protein